MDLRKAFRFFMLILIVELVKALVFSKRTLTESSLLPTNATLAHCPPSCGGIDGISYPFGIGPGCFRPGFELICNSKKLFLSDGATEVSTLASLTDYALTIFAGIYTMAPDVDSYNVSWKTPGRPFYFSIGDVLTIVGCGVDAYLSEFGNNTILGNCTITCGSEEALKKLDGRYCDNEGCCQISLKMSIKAYTLTLVRHGWKNGSVKAFVTEAPYVFNYRDILSNGTINGSNVVNVKLEWLIPDQTTCDKAMENETSYACNSNSVCTSIIGRGYVCLCNNDYIGNPFTAYGCDGFVPYNENRPKSDCPKSCGGIDVPYPFGLTAGCYASARFQLECNGTGPPTIQLDGPLQLYDNPNPYSMGHKFPVTEIMVDEGLLRVKMPSYDRFVVRGIIHGFSYTDTSWYTSTRDWTDLSWVIDNITCQAAIRQSHNYYACISVHSECINIEDKNRGNIVGYRCKCSHGFQGNPYLPQGCTDIDECSLPKPVCEEICHNTVGGYICSKCPVGSEFNPGVRRCIKQQNLLLGIAIGMSGGFAILLFTLSAIFITKKWKRDNEKKARKIYFRKNQGLLLQQLISSDESVADKTKIFSLEELNKATNNFDQTRILGQGGHGTIYKGMMSDQRVVAIKKANIVKQSEIDQFINEVAILSQINHRNIVKLFGCCLESEVPLLVYEFISNGTLYEKLHTDPDNNGLLSWEDRIRIAAEAAGALTYLHSAASISIFHRDVKSLNILLDDNYIAKVSDFGASRSIPTSETHVITAVQGTFGYLDPEYYYTRQLSEKSDVYSFGVILVELLTRKKPLFTNELGEEQNLSNCFLQALKDGSFVELLDDQILQESTKEEINDISHLIEMCLKLRGGERPTMKEVEMRLQFLRAKRKKQPQFTERREENQPSSSNLYTSQREYISSGSVNLRYQDNSMQPSLEKQLMLSMELPR